MQKEYLKLNQSVSIQLGESKQLYVGDLCYVIGCCEVNEEDDWEMICDNNKPKNYWNDVKSEKIKHEIYGAKITFESSVSDREINIVMANTAWGDGCYTAKLGRGVTYEGSKELAVDSGSLGCATLESINPAFHQKARELGMILTLPTHDPVEYMIVSKSYPDSFEHQISQNGKVLVSIKTG